MPCSRRDHRRTPAPRPRTLVLALLAYLKKSRQPAISYTQTKPLTESEQTLYWRLVEALPECLILSQVTFSRFLKPDTAPRSTEYRSLLDKIAQKSADFVVCLKDVTIVAVVERGVALESAAAPTHIALTSKPLAIAALDV